MFKKFAPFYDYFRRGLYESASSTNAWIISGGLNAGVMREVGAARRQYRYSAFKSTYNCGPIIVH